MFSLFKLDLLYFIFIVVRYIYNGTLLKNSINFYYSISIRSTILYHLPFLDLLIFLDSWILKVIFHPSK